MAANESENRSALLPCSLQRAGLKLGSSYCLWVTRCIWMSWKKKKKKKHKRKTRCIRTSWKKKKKELVERARDKRGIVLFKRRTLEWFCENRFTQTRLIKQDWLTDWKSFCLYCTLEGDVCSSLDCWRDSLNPISPVVPNRDLDRDPRGVCLHQWPGPQKTGSIWVLSL